ncbi:hypothetical protein J18TS1_12410 [Oceanobacillus oncorhynchi subsp. incaldanensis]|uniref:hypothetical protein n=1 Tax=Oceanobacillus oncorhynchi TaxID=545501 RepID=UPI001AFF1A21|nr:hypothetical protein [Oceanobacillus oncorhynchi]GIO18141.1 hypothetical protein J18TS1_12410 [Oceanobacillus oncorhynchi subsp. incaldanensis]
MKEKWRKLTKRQKQLIIAGAVLLVIVSFIFYDEDRNQVVLDDTGIEDNTVDDETEQVEAKEEEQPESEEETPAEDEPQEQENVEEVEEESPEWDDLKENIVGKSDKDASEIISNSSTDVQNDTTGDWKKNVISESADTVEYALSYYDEYMEEDETHFIVNLNYGTTTTLNHMGGLLYVDVHEYQDGEEHDASEIGAGMLLKSYVIYPDGDIEEVEL